ncbi:MAG: EamA family transporter [Aureispira sp.]|nr:EamA family transporter [Aureispira sp.]
MDRSMLLSPKAKAYIALALVSFFWGTTYLAIRIGVGTNPEEEQIHGLFLSAVRQSLAGGLLVGFMLLRGTKLPDRKTLLQLIIIGLTMLCLANGLASWALQYVPSGLSSVMSATCPIFIAILSHFLIHPVKWSPRLVGGMLLGLLGIAGLSYDYLEDFLNPAFTFGIILNLIATFLWAVGSIYTAKWKPNTNIMLGAGLQMLFGGLGTWCIVGAMGVKEMVPVPLGWDFWGSIAYLIIFGSFVAYTAFMYTLENLPPTQASLYAYLNPIVAVVLGSIVLTERVNLIMAFAIAITIVGVYLVNTDFQNQGKTKST